MCFFYLKILRRKISKTVFPLRTSIFLKAYLREKSPQMPFIFAVSDFTAPFKGVKLQKIFGLNELRELKNGIRSEINQREDGVYVAPINLLKP